MVLKLALLSCFAISMAHAEPADRPNDASTSWIAQPPTVASTGAAVRLGFGHVERADYEAPVVIMLLTRAYVRVSARLQVDLALEGELGEELVVLAPPTFAATWMTALDESRRFALRGIASPAIVDNLTAMSTNSASSMLAHDPLVAWSAAHTLALQAAVHGGAIVQWGIAASIIELIPSELPRHQTLVRIDAALGGPFAGCWTWAVEVGASSDVLDEESDEGTDLVPLWTAGVHHHRGDISIGAVTTGGWVGGTRSELLGPSVFLQLRGPL